MKGKLLALAAASVWVFASTPALADHNPDPNHFMCYGVKEIKKRCIGETSGVADAKCKIDTKVGPFACVGGLNDGNACGAATDCDTLICQADDCAANGLAGPCHPGLAKLHQISLEDQFNTGGSADPAGAQLFEKLKIKTLCAPADKEDEDPGAESDPEHFQGYAIKPAKDLTPKHVKQFITVHDQFGDWVAQTLKADILLVPTAKNLSGLAGAAPTNYEHFKCYKAKVLKGRCSNDPATKCKADSDCTGGAFCGGALPKGTMVTSKDQFQQHPNNTNGGAASTYDVKKLAHFCNPVDKNGEDPAAPSADLHYACYSVKPTKDLTAKHVPIFDVRTNNQFGDSALSTKKEFELCIPAAKNLPPGTTTTNTTPTTTTTTTTSGCDCCSAGFTQARFETTLASGNGGTLQKFACSNSSDVACVTNAECNLGVCVTLIGGCSGNTGVSCTMDSDCVGTCGEVTTAALPQALVNGGLYTGAGLNSVPLPLPVPDQGVSFTSIDNCSGDTLTLGPTTPADITGEVPANAPTAEVGCTQGRTCSVTTSTTCVLDSDCPSTETCDTNCVFGPQLPIPNSGTPATSVCTINHVAEDAAGTTQCSDGSSDLTAPLRSVVYLTGDLLSSSVGPLDVAGVQPCALCVRQCDDASPNDGEPCTSDGDCTPGTCLAQERCLGGPSGQNGGDGAGGSDPASNTICTPGTSAGLGAAFPTSHACLLDSGQDITSNIGGLPIDFALTSGQIVKDATDLPESLRAFSTFCRDVNNGGSLAFEGDPAADPCINCTSGVAVPCNTDADCQTDTDTYESCAQRDPGAFSRAAATRITVNGATDGQCLDDGLTHPATLVSVFDIPPTFDSTVDGAGDLPGPGSALIQGEAQLIP